MSSKKSILIVEDNQPAREALKGLLGLYKGFSVDTCTNGEEAVEMAVNGDYDVIIMDIGLPGIDGIEATRIIKQNKPNQKVIAHSGHSDIPDGLFNDNYPKPTLSLNIEEFIKTFFGDL